MPTAELRRAARRAVVAAWLLGALVGGAHAALTSKET